MDINAEIEKLGYTSLIEGFLGKNQKAHFQKRLKTLETIRTVAEVGFNAGHSAQVFLDNLPDLEKFFSFDINSHPYTPIMVEKFQKHYGDRFVFVPGDSSVTIPLFSQNHPDLTCDLIYIDGNHTLEHAASDILHCKKLAHSKTLLWIDDVGYDSLQQAVTFALSLNVIEEPQVFITQNNNYIERVWAETRYLF